jgi:hypothetical protein
MDKIQQLTDIINNEVNSITTIDPDNNIVLSPKFDDFLDKFIRAKKLLEDAEKVLKEKIKLIMEDQELGKKIEGDKVTVLYKRKYEKILTDIKELKKDKEGKKMIKTKYSLDTKLRDAYIKKYKKLPPGVTEIYKGSSLEFRQND